MENDKPRDASNVCTGSLRHCAKFDARISNSNIERDRVIHGRMRAACQYRHGRRFTNSFSGKTNEGYLLQTRRTETLLLIDLYSGDVMADISYFNPISSMQSIDCELIANACVQNYTVAFDKFPSRHFTQLYN